MFPIKMIGDGDPNQLNRPNVFGFQPYPSSSAIRPDSWSAVTQITQPFPVLPIGSMHVTPQTIIQHPQVGLPNFSFGGLQKPTEGVVQFPFQVNSDDNFANRGIHSNDGFGYRPSSQPLRCKRKTDSPPLQSCKQHITEEKMAEHMSKLHISSETVATSESDLVREQRLYMCEEMRKLQSDSILPQCLLNRIQRPCTALVLWTPPVRLIPNVNNIDEESANNNDEAATDNNRMENEPVNMEGDLLVNNVDEMDDL